MPKLLRLLARLDDGAFLLCQQGDHLVVLDQRQLRRQLLVAQLQRELAQGGKLVAQQLLFPARCEASSERQERVEKAASMLLRLGFDVRSSGPRTLTIHAVPRLLATTASEQLFDAVLLALPDTETMLDGPTLESVLRALVRLVATTEELSEQQALALTSSWDELHQQPLAERRAVVALIEMEELRRKAAARD